MTASVEDRISALIEAYFTFPRDRYAALVAQIRQTGGLTSSEVRALKDRVVYIHSDTILRHAGLNEGSSDRVVSAAGR
ncbi:MAG TPA: hypothetical protein VJX67_05560 [Blastocatellia bacterium]|nr:hypothetical protein [Blastocatellia bacterium]